MVTMYSKYTELLWWACSTIEPPWFNSLFGVQRLVFGNIVTRDKSFVPAILVLREPPVGILRADDVEKISFLEAQIVLRARVVVVLANKQRLVSLGRAWKRTQTASIAIAISVFLCRLQITSVTRDTIVAHSISWWSHYVRLLVRPKTSCIYIIIYTDPKSKMG